MPAVSVASGDAAHDGLSWSPVSSEISIDRSVGSKWQGVAAPEGEEGESSEWFDV